MVQQRQSDALVLFGATGDLAYKKMSQRPVSEISHTVRSSFHLNSPSTFSKEGENASERIPPLKKGRQKRDLRSSLAAGIKSVRDLEQTEPLTFHRVS